uniref:Complexin-2 n=1 Tax=Anolis carolinensis TaxID=28377 RepID=A0A803TH54_ANOCA
MIRGFFLFCFLHFVACPPISLSSLPTFWHQDQSGGDQGATKDMGKMLGGEEEKDPDAQKKEEERQEALRQQEEERKAKHARMEAEREKVRQQIRDKVRNILC